MALASWTGLYTPVVQSLMRQKRIKELLLLQVIAQHADPFGFCWPGAKTLRGLMRCSQPTLEKLMDWLANENYIKVYQTYNPRRGKEEIDYQVNPRVLYVREEIQEYCDALWDGEDRDFFFEKKIRGNLFSTKESQPESESDSDSESANQSQDHHHHHNAAVKKQGKDGASLREIPQRKTTEQRDSATNQRTAQNSKDNPQAGGPARDPLPNVDDETLAREIVLTVGTQITQARAAIKTYPRPEVLIALELTRQKRSRGELAKPGGYFFATLKNGVIVPDQDAPQVFPPRNTFGETPEQDGVQHWNPQTGRYELAVGD